MIIIVVVNAITIVIAEDIPFAVGRQYDDARIAEVDIESVGIFAQLSLIVVIEEVVVGVDNSDSSIEFVIPCIAVGRRRIDLRGQIGGIIIGIERSSSKPPPG